MFLLADNNKSSKGLDRSLRLGAFACNSLTPSRQGAKRTTQTKTDVRRPSSSISRLSILSAALIVELLRQEQ